MDLTKLKLEPKDYVKGFTLMFGLMTVYFNLRLEIRENKMVNNADKVVFNYRISHIEDFLKINRMTSSMATLPTSPSIKDEE